VLSVRTDYGGYKSRLLKKIISSSYKKLDAIVCQSQDMKNDFVKNFDINKNKLNVIGNTISRHVLNSNKKSNTNIKRINFITVGRLSEEKGHSKILNYDFNYTIVGDGPLVSQIKNKVEHNNLKNKVTFKKYTSKILEEVYKNDYFLQGSYVGGFPNSVLESCSIGCQL
jgi:glycosyltransferase involved in cell wall biosynthesis